MVHCRNRHGGDAWAAKVADRVPQALVEKIATIGKLVGAHPDPRRMQRSSQSAGPPRLLLIGASTGGPKAIAEILAPLPHDWNVAVIVVQIGRAHV